MYFKNVHALSYNLFNTNTLHVVYYRFNQKSDGIYTNVTNSVKKKRDKKFQLNKILDKFSAILYAAVKSSISWKFINFFYYKILSKSKFVSLSFLTIRNLEGDKKLL